MKQFPLILFTLGLFALPAQSRACTDVLGWESAPKRWQSASGQKPARPDIRVRRLERGDGATGKKPCGHRVFLELEIFNPIDSNVAGFYFAVPKGSRPYFHVPTMLTYPKQFKDGRVGFWFSWLEALTVDGLLPPVAFELHISQVSSTGAVGAPIEIRIEDSGGLPSNKSLQQVGHN